MTDDYGIDFSCYQHSRELKHGLLYEYNKKNLRINDKEENSKEKAYYALYEATVLGFNFFSFGEGKKSAYMSNSYSQAKITNS